MTATAIPNAPAPKRRADNALTSGQLPRGFEAWSLVGAFAISAVIFLIVGFSIVGWVVVAAVLYLLIVGVISSFVENRRKATDRLVRGIVVITFLLAITPLVSTLVDVFTRGYHDALNLHFIFGKTTRTLDPTTFKITQQLGALQGVVGTLIITGIAAVISIPIGILTAVYLVEYGRPKAWMNRVVTFLVDVMTGIPSIVAGLFAFSLFTLIAGPKAFSGFSASIALCVLMIPIVVRSSEEMLKLVSTELREASYALGVTKFVTITRIVLPTAISGLITGVMISIARVIGETAPIFIAASFTDNFNADPFRDAMSTLPVIAYTGYKFPGTDIPASYNAAWGAAMLLVFLVIILNLIARILARVLAPKGLR